MKLLHQGYGMLVRTLQRFHHQPPQAISVPQSFLDNAQLVSDRLELLRRLPQCGRGMECGVDEGKFSRQILDTCQPRELILVDTWDSKRFSSSKMQRVQDDFTDEIAAGKIHIECSTSIEALSRVADATLDWIYIDTDHSFGTTHGELVLASKKVKRDGYICGHDYTLGSWRGYIRYGVVEAVNAFCVEHRWEFAYLTHESNRNLSFALKRCV